MGKPEKAGCGRWRRNPPKCASQNTDHVRTRSASLRWGEGRQDVKTYGHTGRSLPVWLFLLPKNRIQVLWPGSSRAEQGKPVEIRRRRATVMCQRFCQYAIAEKARRRQRCTKPGDLQSRNDLRTRRRTVRSQQAGALCPEYGGIRFEQKGKGSLF